MLDTTSDKSVIYVFDVNILLSKCIENILTLPNHPRPISLRYCNRFLEKSSAPVKHWSFEYSFCKQKYVSS